MRTASAPSLSLPFTAPSFLKDLPLASRALQYASRLHSGQRRESDEAPFILHPLEVASLLHNTGHADHVVAAAILHDSVEDTAAETDDIARRFGLRVALLVQAVTEDATIEPYAERKARLRRLIADVDDQARAIYAADKVAKVRELRAQATLDPTLLGSGRPDIERKLDHYDRSLDVLEARMPAHPLVRQLRFELEMLRALPPGR